MSCGNRFQCGITRFQKHSFTPDKPSNPELHNENQKHLAELLKAREDIDKMFTQTSSAMQTTNIPENILNLPESLEQNTVYTPWKVPSSK
jgi:hypothetical protein